ncbi:MAG: YfhO family protein, partial [Acutalibacter sp.]
SIFFIALGKTQSEYTWDHLIPYNLNGGKSVDLPDLQESRSDFYESLDNAAMFWQIPSIQAFHSVVPGSIMEFYDSIGVPRDVGSRPTTDHYAIRGLLSVHWLFDDDHDDAYFAGEDMSDPAMPGFAYYGNANGYDIWENQYYIPMGFSYDYYITRSEYNALNEGSENAIGDRELAMLRAIVIEDDRVQYYEGILEHLPESMRSFTENGYLQDCLDRRTRSCSSFTYTNTGFTAQIDSTQEQIIFFSVPYEAGWSAMVNGEPVAIEKVNVGFMAVVVPEGDSVTIEFTYRTPGLALGFGITLVSLALLVAYLMLMNRVRPRPAPQRGPSLLRVGKFSQYAKSRHVTFRGPKAMVIHGKREAAVPEEEAPAPLPPPAEGQAASPEGKTTTDE